VLRPGINGAHLSTSITTIAFEATAGGTHLTYTEPGILLDKNDNPAPREEGTSGLFDSLGALLTS
jgi:hypothetical protein